MIDDYPLITTLDDLISKEDLAKKLKVTPATVSLWRFDEPPLPYIRFKGHVWFAESQVAWWVNRWQREHPDPYYADRMRRVRAGLKIGSGRRPANAPPKVK